MGTLSLSNEGALHPDGAHDIHKIVQITTIYTCIIIELFHNKQLQLEIFSIIASNPQLVAQFPSRGTLTSNSI